MLKSLAVISLIAGASTTAILASRTQSDADRSSEPRTALAASPYQSANDPSVLRTLAGGPTLAGADNIRGVILDSNQPNVPSLGAAAWLIGSCGLSSVQDGRVDLVISQDDGNRLVATEEADNLMRGDFTPDMIACIQASVAALTPHDLPDGLTEKLPFTVSLIGSKKTVSQASSGVIPNTVATSSANHLPYPLVGPDTATYKLMVYTDYQCAFCTKLQMTLAALRNELGDSLLIEYRFMPLPSHPESRLAAMAAWIAAGQNRFDAMHSALLANATSLGSEAITALAQALGFEKEAFAKDLNSSLYDEAVEISFREAQAAGIRALPTVVVGGQTLEGALSLADYRRALGLAEAN